MQKKEINSIKIIEPVAEHPPLADHYLKRPALEHALHSAFKKPLITVVGGAGYGKTQAVLAALKSWECHMAWLQLSELDNHIARFWRRLAYAFEPQSPQLPDCLISLGYPESIVSFDRFLLLLAKGLAHYKRFVFVLDDFHEIHNKAILNFIELFIGAGLPRFSIVLITRKKPDLPLSGMLSKGWLARIGEDDLRFSQDEMEAYFCQQDFELCENSASSIYSYTDGWICAIYLVGLAAQKGSLNKQNPVLPAKIDIFDLIEKEIFNTAPKELQDFLIKISILDIIPSQLLRELANHDKKLISEITQISMFIRYDAYSDSYRIQQLFKEFLQTKKSCLTEPAISEIHLKAAKWHAHNNNRFEAIYHYKKIACYDEIFDIIIAIPGRVPQETANSIIELIEQAPQEVVSSRPIIRVVKGGYLFNNNRLAEAKQELISLQKEYEAQPKTEKNRIILGETYLLLALICLVSSDFAFENLFRLADEYLPQGSQLVDYQTGIAEGVNACSISNPCPGELQRYQEALFSAAPFAAKAMNGCGYGLEYLNAAESALYTGEWKSAEQYAYEAIYRSRQFKQYDIEYIANFVLVRIFTAKGNYQKVKGILDGIKAHAASLQLTDCIILYDMINGWFYTKLNQTAKVAKWIRQEEEACKVLAPVVIGREHQVRCDCLLEEGRYYELLALLEQTDKKYENRGILFALTQNKITKAIVHHYLGNQEESLRFLKESYELTYPNNLIMQYIEYGNKMRTLLYAAKQNKNCPIPSAWLDKIHTKSSSYAKMLAQIVSACHKVHETKNISKFNLSKREEEVLAYLCQGMTRKEISASCYISLSTVNSIFKNIYDKLGAVNAAQAVRIAKEQGLY
ncbi:MAG: LuxR C-terminal-related transcriptional regulator [Clostridiales bacterium]|nr:LuxR C-terminal-related transcriptional regulator [Clostridiales bacterium]